MFALLPRRLLTVSTIGLLLGACGGGGGGGSDGGSSDQTLYVSLGYPSAHLNLFAAATVMPMLGGFDGHAPNCTLISGTMPPGMTLQGNCQLVGRPTQASNYPITVRVGASGASNTITTGATINVDGPGAFYPSRSAFMNGFTLGTVVSDAPTISNWTAPTDTPLTWAYALRSGSLPPGLSLNSTTGVISGTVTSTGAYSATIQPTLTTAFGTYQLPISTYSANIGVATFTYANVGGTGSVNSSLQVAYRAQPFRMTASPGPGAAVGTTLSNFRMVPGNTLPAGLSLDAATGTISGMPTTAATSTSGFGVSVQADVTAGAAVNSSTTAVAIEVRTPVNIFYPSSTTTARRGVALSFTPTVVVNTPLALINPTYSFTGRSTDCSLPPGTSLNANTGVLTGTPTATGAFLCTVDIAATTNGVGYPASASLYVLVTQ